MGSTRNDREALVGLRVAQEVAVGDLPAVALLGPFGGHRFYLGMKPSGIAMACLACVSAVTWCVLWETPDEALLASTVTAVPLLAWVLSDIFRLPGFVRDYNDRLIRWVGGDLTRRRPGRGRYGRTWMTRR